MLRGLQGIWALRLLQPPLGYPSQSQGELPPEQAWLGPGGPWTAVLTALPRHRPAVQLQRVKVSQKAS